MLGVERKQDGEIESNSSDQADMTFFFFFNVVYYWPLESDSTSNRHLGKGLFSFQ